MPTLAEVRPIVQREWEAEQRSSATASLLAKLRARYDVRVEGPAAEIFAAGTTSQAGAGGQ
jgi:hypothetical protein